MIRFYLYIIVLVFPVKMYTQKPEIKVKVTDRIIGTNLITQSPIRAREYTFPERIHYCHIDTITGLATVQMRELNKKKTSLKSKGSIAVFDLFNNLIKWSKKINYSKTNIQYFDNAIFLTERRKSMMLDINDGEPRIEFKNIVSLVDPVNDIGIGYELHKFKITHNNLQGYNLSDGQILWSRKIKNDFGWNDVIITSDSTYLIVSSGLHEINIYDGSGWDYDAITGEKKSFSNNYYRIVEYLLGKAPGSFQVGTDFNKIRDITSNLIMDSIRYFFASRDSIVSIDKKDGNVLWSYPIPINFGSKSRIFMDDSLVYMVNFGYAHADFFRIHHGKPFFAAFNKDTGKSKYFNYIQVKKDPVNDFEVMGDSLYLLFSERITTYSIASGVPVNEKEFVDDPSGKFLGFVSHHVFIRQDTVFTPLILTDTSNLFIYTSENVIVSINQENYFIEEIDPKSLYTTRLAIPFLHFLSTKDKTCILDHRKRLIAELDIDGNSALIDDKLFVVKDKSIISIDMLQLYVDFESMIEMDGF